MKTHDADPPLYPAPSSSADITLKEAALRVIGNVVRYEGVKAAFVRLKALTAEFGEVEGWPQIVQECRKAINEMRQRMEQEGMRLQAQNIYIKTGQLSMGDNATLNYFEEE